MNGNTLAFCIVAVFTLGADAGLGFGRPIPITSGADHGLGPTSVNPHIGIKMDCRNFQRTQCLQRRKPIHTRLELSR